MTLADRIRAKITQAFNPEHIEVINESHLHKGHAGDDGTGETHYKLMIVSKTFKGKSRVERQKEIHKVLAHELSTQIHALSITAKEEM